ncbi:MAG: hypothetical protein AAGF74_00345 [Pseudomonadota bacterium]
MIRRIISLLIVALVALALFYISRFWDFRLWGREGLLGIQALRPQGGLLAQWLRGTPFAPYELVIWTAGSVLVLTGLERLFHLIPSSPSPEGELDEG